MSAPIKNLKNLRTSPKRPIVGRLRNRPNVHCVGLRRILGDRQRDEEFAVGEARKEAIEEHLSLIEDVFNRFYSGRELLVDEETSDRSVMEVSKETQIGKFERFQRLKRHRKAKAAICNGDIANLIVDYIDGLPNVFSFASAIGATGSSLPCVTQIVLTTPIFSLYSPVIDTRVFYLYGDIAMEILGELCRLERTIILKKYPSRGWGYPARILEKSGWDVLSEQVETPEKFKIYFCSPVVDRHASERWKKRLTIGDRQN